MTKYHPEHWSPVWTGTFWLILVRKMLEAIQAFMPIDEQGVGALSYSADERKKIAINSRNYQCPVCTHKLKEDEVTIIGNRGIAEENHQREKRERLLSEKMMIEQAAQKEEEIKQYYLKKSIDESDLPEQLQRQFSAPVPLFGASPKGIFGAGPNIPCYKSTKPKEEAANLGKRMAENKQEETNLGEVSVKLHQVRFGLNVESLNRTRKQPDPLLRPIPAHTNQRIPEISRQTDASMREEITEGSPIEMNQADVRERNRVLIEDFLARRDVASLEAILRRQLAQGTLRPEDIMATQYNHFIDKINKVTYTHRDQVYDSLAGLLEEAIEMQTVSRTVEFHESEAAREEADREKRKKLEEARKREIQEEEGGDEEQPHEMTEEERIQHSEEYRQLQKRQKLLDFMIYSLVFLTITYFAWDVVKLMFGM